MPVKRGRGQPSKLTPERKAKFVNALKVGNSVECSARFAGLGESTVHRWLARGEHETTGQYREFWEETAEARATAETAAVSYIRSAMPKHWGAAAWYLEHSNPLKWGPRIKVTIENELNATLDRLEKSLPPDLYERVLVAIAARDGSGAIAGSSAESEGEASSAS